MKFPCLCQCERLLMLRNIKKKWDNLKQVSSGDDSIYLWTMNKEDKNETCTTKPSSSMQVRIHIFMKIKSVILCWIKVEWQHMEQVLEHIKVVTEFVNQNRFSKFLIPFYDMTCKCKQSNAFSCNKTATSIIQCNTLRHKKLAFKRQ